MRAAPADVCAWMLANGTMAIFIGSGPADRFVNAHMFVGVRSIVFQHKTHANAPTASTPNEPHRCIAGRVPSSNGEHGKRNGNAVPCSQTLDPKYGHGQHVLGHEPLAVSTLSAIERTHYLKTTLAADTGAND